MTDAIRFQDVTLRQGELTRLDTLSFNAGKGEVLALLGHNGAGKTTTMHLILGLLSPTAGQLNVLDNNPGSRQVAQHLGYLPENVSFYDALSGHEVLNYFARLKRADKYQTTSLLEKVGLGHAAKRRVKTYSKGMRQRLGLAQALLGEPQLLLLDEPTTGLDPAATREFYTTLDELRSRGGTVILSSHILPGIEPYIDRALILGNGKKLALGSTDQLRQQAALPLIVRVHGHPAGRDWQDLVDNPRHELLLEEASRSDLAIPPAHKLDTLRQLTDMAGVNDITVEAPTLEHLYQHVSRSISQ